MSKQFEWTTYGYMYYQGERYRLLSLPTDKDMKEKYKHFTDKYDLSFYGVQSTTAAWGDRDYNFQIKEDKLYFHSLILKTGMDTETLQTKLSEDGIKTWIIGKEGINVLTEFYSKGNVFAHWANGLVKIVLSQKVVDGMEVFNERHFSIENGIIVKTEEVTKKYKTFASCIEE